MLKKTFSFCPAAVLVLALVVSNAQAKSFRAGLFGNLGYGVFAMDDVNQDFIQPLNDLAASVGGTRINKITGGVAGNLGVKFLIGNHLLVGASLGYLGAGTHAEVSVLDVPSGTIDINLPALEEGPFAKAAWFVTRDVMLTAGGEVDYLYLFGSVKSASAISAAGSKDNWTGTGLGVKVVAGAEFFLGDHFAIMGDAGYRFARVLEIRNQDNLRIIENDGGNFTVDYSGPFFLGGVSVYF